MAPCSANQHLGEAEQRGERVGEENHEEWAFLVNDRRVRRRRDEEEGEERADAAKKNRRWGKSVIRVDVL